MFWLDIKFYSVNIDYGGKSREVEVVVVKGIQGVQMENKIMKDIQE